LSCRYIKLGEVADVKNGYAFKSKDFVDTGIPIIKIKNITPPNVTLEDVQFVSGKIFEETKRFKVEYNDILISMTGSGANQMSSAVGKIGRVRFQDTALQNQRVGKIIVKDESKYDSNFLYYFLTQTTVLEFFVFNSTGSANQANISAKLIKDLLVPDIDIKCQKDIATVLSSLDKKIENNNKIIANLETQAQAIFKSRFVDFEPFQDGQFVESELGMIPEGWEVKTLGDFFPVITGKKNANIVIDNGEYPFFTCSQGIFYTDDYSFDANAILLAGNGDFNVKRYNGKFEAYQRTYILIPYDEKYVGLLYNLIEFYLPQIVSGHKGSVINYITKGMIEEFKFAVPNDMPAKTLKLFNDYENFIAHLKKEVKNLEITRDTLLPKLMSGEIRVGQDDIEEIENLL